MKIIYNPDVLGFQIIHTQNDFIKPCVWGKPVNCTVYRTYDEASAMLDKWEA